MTKVSKEITLHPFRK